MFSKIGVFCLVTSVHHSSAGLSGFSTLSNALTILVSMAWTGKRFVTHLIWADKIEAHWKIIGDANSILIEEVEKGLPQGLVQTMIVLAMAENDYKEWLQCIWQVDYRKARAKVLEIKEHKEMQSWQAEMMSSNITPYHYPPTQQTQLMPSPTITCNTPFVTLSQRLAETTFNMPTSTLPITPKQPATLT